MTEMKFFGARLEADLARMIEDTAKEEHVDKTKALKDLLLLGRKQFLLQKYLEMYGKGLCSIDKAAHEVGITVNEMMREASKAGLWSEETVEDYKRGLGILRSVTR